MDDFEDYEQQIHGCNKMQYLAIAGGQTVCYHQRVYDDTRVEPTEYTGLTLLVSNTTAATVVERSHTVIRINDDDCKCEEVNE